MSGFIIIYGLLILLKERVVYEQTAHFQLQTVEILSKEIVNA